MSHERTQTVCPYLYYSDGVAALGFLCRAFGFQERSRDVRDDGSLNHAEVAHGEDVIMLGTPQNGGGTHGGHDSSMMCYLDDVDGHCARARDAGAEIVSEPQDSPYGRVYCAADLEGRRWYFCSV